MISNQNRGLTGTLVLGLALALGSTASVAKKPNN